MAAFHIKVGKILQGKSAGGSTGFAQYIARENVTHTTQHVRYLSREDAPDTGDLVAAGAANLPSWAQTDLDFWRQADTFERQGGIVARTWEIMLPRELSPEHRRELADDIRAVHFGRHVHSWAIHNPRTRDGRHEQPHLHVMVNERVLDGHDRGPKMFFSRAATAGQDPQLGGARKDLSWNHRERVREVRESVALLINASLERHGHQVAVSPKTLHARGFERAPEREQTPGEKYLYAKQGISTQQWQQTLERRHDLQHNHHPWEREIARVEWQQTRAQSNLDDLSRDEVRAYATARFAGHAARTVGEHARPETAHDHHRAPEQTVYANDLTPGSTTPDTGERADERRPEAAAFVKDKTLAGGISLGDVVVREAAPAGHTSGPDLRRLHHDMEYSR